MKLFAYAFAVLFLGTSALLFQNNAGVDPMQAQLAADGAYRDGLYLGSLARESDSHRAAPVGRWSTEKDRAAFAMGYQRGLAGSAQ